MFVKRLLKCIRSPCISCCTRLCFFQIFQSFILASGVYVTYPKGKQIIRFPIISNYFFDGAQAKSFGTAAGCCTFWHLTSHVHWCSGQRGGKKRPRLLHHLFTRLCIYFSPWMLLSKSFSEKKLKWSGRAPQSIPQPSSANQAICQKSYFGSYAWTSTWPLDYVCSFWSQTLLWYNGLVEAICCFPRSRDLLFLGDLTGSRRYPESKSASTAQCSTLRSHRYQLFERWTRWKGGSCFTKTVESAPHKCSRWH